MGNYYGSSSKKRYDTLHPKLQKVLIRVLTIKDHSITFGYRTEQEQKAAFEGGFSNLEWPDSTHNGLPSTGVDIAPYPIVWTDTDDFCVLAGVVLAVAHELGIKLRWGGTWKKPKDYGHFEFVE